MCETDARRPGFQGVTALTKRGDAGAAALFRAQARAESVHAGRFARLESNGHAVPEPHPHRPAVGDTGDNLRAAAAAEAAERDGIYRDAIETCRFHGATALATMFDQTRDAEVEHGNLCMAAARNLASMKQACPNGLEACYSPPPWTTASKSWRRCTAPTSPYSSSGTTAPSRAAASITW